MGGLAGIRTLVERLPAIATCGRKARAAMQEQKHTRRSTRDDLQTQYLTLHAQWTMLQQYFHRESRILLSLRGMPSSVIAALLVAGGLCLVHTLSAHHAVFVPGAVWVDTDGHPINAHGGGILYHQGTYYWFGEIKTGPTWRVPSVTSWAAYRVQAGGVSCYTSPDLLHWTYAGVALPPQPLDHTHDLHPSKVMERPKVLYNAKTTHFVMWLHVDTDDYRYAHAGVAVSRTPCGPYRYLGSVRPNGHEARDMTVYQDEDGKAYHIYAAEQQTLRIALLSADYVAHTPYDHRLAAAAGTA